MKTATLLYVIKSNKVLLIKKKRGIGKGLYNAPGGHVEKGETIENAAIREIREELDITPINPAFIGTNDFYFGKKHIMKVHVFVSDDYKGTEKETDEAAPFWFPLTEIPYKEMWPDDEHWMPLMLEGKKFKGEFYYDEKGKVILNHNIETQEVGK
jgi:8-oxo-dGTP diphosphatase